MKIGDVFKIDVEAVEKRHPDSCDGCMYYQLEDSDWKPHRRCVCGDEEIRNTCSDGDGFIVSSC